MKLRCLVGVAMVVIALFPWAGCGQDTASVVSPCPPESAASAIETWRDRAIIIPRSRSREILPPALSQGVSPTMSRTEVETLLANYLSFRRPNRSEFETPLGRVEWRLDREVSGGEVAELPRTYLYPTRLGLVDVLDTHTMQCLERASPRVRYVIVRRSDGKGQLATLVVEEFAIKHVIWPQDHPSPGREPAAPP